MSEENKQLQKKPSKSKKTVAQSNCIYSKVEIILALFIIAVASVPLVFILANSIVYKTGNIVQTGIIIICVLAIAFAFFMIQDGFKRSMLVRLFRDYTKRLTDDPNRSIVTLAKAKKVSAKTIRNNLEYLIDKKWYVNTKLDLKNKRVIFYNENIPDAIVPLSKASSIITCKYCRGINYTTENNYEKCCYCGSPLKK